MYTSPPLKTFMVVPDTSPLDAVAISLPTPSKSLKRNPAVGLPSLRSPSLATLERACQKIFRKPLLHSASPITLSGATTTGYGKGYARYGLGWPEMRILVLAGVRRRHEADHLCEQRR